MTHYINFITPSEWNLKNIIQGKYIGPISYILR